MEVARDSSRHVLSDTTVAVAQALVRTLGGDQSPREVAQRLIRLRHDTQVANTMARDVGRAQEQASILIGDALWMGYRRGATGRAKAMSGDVLSIDVNLTPEDRRVLVADYPILGHTAAEAASHLAGKLRYDLDAALTLPITGSSDPATLPADLQALGDEHANRVAGAVDAAYFAGIQAAMKAIGAALTGA